MKHEESSSDLPLSQNAGGQSLSSEIQPDTVIPSKKAPYFLHQLALLATINPLPADTIRAALLQMSSEELNELLHFIYRHKLLFFWLRACRAIPDLPFSQATQEQLRNDCFRKSALYLMQKKTIIELDNLLEKEQIPYVIFKGAHTRELVYDDPAFRPSVDIDLLVADGDKIRTIRLLCANGYVLKINQENISHEATLVSNDVHIDLHWQIMRPGRTRVEMTDIFLRSRQRCGFFWGLDNETTLLVLLTHPVFTKYATAPHSSVIWFVDLREWLVRQPLDWQRLLRLLEKSGLKTAAWIIATILEVLTGHQIPSLVLQSITPKNPKRYFLLIWLNLNLSARLADYPAFTRYIFTLLAHDRLADTINFIRIFRKERRESGQKIKEIQQVSRQ